MIRDWVWLNLLLITEYLNPLNPGEANKYLSIYATIHLLINSAVHPSICLGIHPSSIHPSIYHLSVRSSVRSSIHHPSIHSSIHTFTTPSIHPSIFPSIHPSIRPFLTKSSSIVSFADSDQIWATFELLDIDCCWVEILEPKERTVLAPVS